MASLKFLCSLATVYQSQSVADLFQSIDVNRSHTRMHLSLLQITIAIHSLMAELSIYHIYIEIDKLEENKVLLIEIDRQKQESKES